MQLRAYLNANDLTVLAFAGRLGVSVQTVHRYLTGERVPRRDVMARISCVTKGRVTPNDFFELAKAA